MAKYKVTVLMQPTERNNNTTVIETKIESNSIMIEGGSIVFYSTHRSPDDVAGIFPCANTVVEEIL